jgi:hypothetical protein
MATLIAAARSRPRCARSWALKHGNSLRHDAQAPDGRFPTKGRDRQDKTNYRSWRILDIAAGATNVCNPPLALGGTIFVGRGSIPERGIKFEEVRQDAMQPIEML